MIIATFLMVLFEYTFFSFRVALVADGKCLLPKSNFRVALVADGKCVLPKVNYKTNS